MTYANRSLSTPFADDLPPPPITMGRDVVFGSVTPTTAPTVIANDPTAILSNEAIYRAFVELVENDPSYLHRLAAKMKYRAPFKESKAVVGLPMTKLRTVEVAIEDKGPPKATKRVRPDREALRFHCTVQVTTPGTSQVSCPDWFGRASFRSPERMKIDATGELMRKKSITATYSDWLVNEIIPLATHNDYLIGCLRIDVEKGGNPHADRQVILIDRAGVEAGDLSGAILISKENGKTTMAELPRFDTKTSKGNPLQAGLSMQSRGARLSEKLDWRTGEIKVAA